MNNIHYAFTFLSLDTVIKYLSSGDQAADQIIRVWTEVFLSVCATHVYGESKQRVRKWLKLLQQKIQAKTNYS